MGPIVWSLRVLDPYHSNPIMKNQLIWLTGLAACAAAYASNAPEGDEPAVKAQSFEFKAPTRLQAAGKNIEVEAPGYASPAWHDVNGDGKKDLVVGQFNGGKLMVYQNQGDQGLGEGTWLQAGGAPASVPGVW